MRVVHIIPSVGLRSFGVGPVPLNLVREQTSLGISSTIWCLDNDATLEWASSSSGLMHEYFRSFPTFGPSMFCLSLAMEKAGRFEVDNATILHQHGIWTGVSRVTQVMRHYHQMATVIAPHGSLESWALKKSHWKKQIALTMYERDNLQRASCFHACSEQEISGIRNFGLRNPIAVIPNGVNESWLVSSGSSDDFRRHYHISQDKRVMLFLSRVTPVKGLILLIEALHTILRSLDHWLLVVAGADEFDHKTEVINKIRDMRLDNYVMFTGMLTGQAKRDAFATAELFVLPTKRENFAIVVAEALGIGIPVLTTKGAPWEELLKYNCGWWVDVNSKAIAEGLKDALKRSPIELHRMGQRGKQLVVAKYTWGKAAQMTRVLYEWLLDRKEKPDFVVID